VVGDVGKACLYDITFLNSSFSKFAKMDDMTFDTENQSPLPGNKSSFMNKSPNNISPTRKQNQLRWPYFKGWFNAHPIPKLDNSFVVTVKYASVMRIFVSGTSKGDVRLWSTECELLGILNSKENPWDNRRILEVISVIEQEIRK
jgi:hypothetical protein